MVGVRLRHGDDEEGADVEEVDEQRAVVYSLPKNLFALLPYRKRRGGVSEIYSPVDRVCGGRDGVTGGSSSKGTTVGVRMEQM